MSIDHTQILRAGELVVLSSQIPITALIKPVCLPGIPRALDREFGGRGWIRGTVKVEGSPPIPGWRRVRLFDEQSGRLIAETWSDPQSGAYTFDWIRPTRRYTVLSYDHTGTHRAVVADHLTPEPMP